MRVVTLASGSSGNCHILIANNGRKILLDCGIKFKTIITKEAFGWVNEYDFVYVSHEHIDHSRAMEDFVKAGVKVVSYLAPQLNPVKIGQFVIKMFYLQHSVDNYGIIIVDTLTGEKFAYATDFISLPQILGLDTFLCEVNHDTDIINGRVNKYGLDGLNMGFKWHFSLQQMIEWLKKCKEPPKELIICHTSKDNAVKNKILKEIRKYIKNARFA